MASQSMVPRAAHAVPILYIVVVNIIQVVVGQNGTSPSFSFSAVNLSSASTLTWLTNSSGILIDPVSDAQLGACYYTVDAGATFTPLSTILINNVTAVYLAPPSSRVVLQGGTASSAAVLDAIISTNAHMLFTVVASELPNIVPVNTGNIPSSVVIDPENSSNILLYDNSTNTLSVSVDAGDSWNTIVTGMYKGNTAASISFSWGFSAVDPPHKIFAINQSSIVPRAVAEQNQLFSSEDFGRTWSPELDSRVNVRHVNLWSILSMSRA